MKSIFLLFGVLGAVSNASECQADEHSLLQSKKRVRKHAQGDSQAALKKMRDVANSLLEGSDTTMTSDEVSDALEAASSALAELSPAIHQQIQNVQGQINDAASAVQVCHTQGQAETAQLRDYLQRRAAAVVSCQETLGHIQADATRQCGIAEDCLCDEARQRATDQEALCASMLETYEAAFCGHHDVCTIFHQCHSSEAEVFARMRADAEAQMAIIVQEYIAVEQSRCITGLVMEAMTPPITPVPHAALIACDNVDVSAIRVDYPNLPAEPTACPAHEHGNPECVAGAPQNRLSHCSGVVVDLDNLQPREGSPSGCTCTRVELQGSYSAGPVVRCDDCLDTYRSTDANSCPSGFKIFSPRSQEDWNTLHSSVAMSSLMGPNLIADITRPSDGCGGCTSYAMNSDTAEQSSWVTSDGTPWFLRSTTYGEPNGDYTANCYLSISHNLANGEMTFNDHNCNHHSTKYLCQIEECSPPPAPAPAPPPVGSGPYGHLGCYQSYVWNANLGSVHYSGSRMTVPADQRLATCNLECRSAGYDQFGIEHVTACICGNAAQLVMPRAEGCRDGFGWAYRTDVYTVQ